MKQDAALPLFSVLIPSYNRPELLVATIDSVLAQAFKDFEVIVSDDASPRGVEISAAVAKYNNDSRFRFILQPKNLGWSDNRNALLAEARGGYVLLLGDDDLLPARALERLAEQLNRKPKSDLIAFGYEVIDIEGNHSYTRHCPEAFSLQVGPAKMWKALFYWDTVPMWVFHPFTLCCRRDLALEWRYDKRCGIADDALFLFRALDSGCTIDVLPDVLVSWRRALKITDGYLNLSSDQSADNKGRFNLWRTTQETVWREPVVQALIHSAEFTRYCLRLEPSFAKEFSLLGRTGKTAALDEAKSRYEKLLLAPQKWKASIFSKCLVLYKLGGVRFVFSVLSAVRMRHFIS